MRCNTDISKFCRFFRRVLRLVKNFTKPITRNCLTLRRFQCAVIIRSYTKTFLKHTKNSNHSKWSYGQDFYRTTKLNGTVFVLTQSTMCIARSSFSNEYVPLHKSFKQINVEFSKFNPEVQRIPRLEEEEAKIPIRKTGIESDDSCPPEDKTRTCTCRRGYKCCVDGFDDLVSK